MGSAHEASHGSIGAQIERMVACGFRGKVLLTFGGSPRNLRLDLVEEAHGADQVHKVLATRAAQTQAA